MFPILPCRTYLLLNSLSVWLSAQKPSSWLSKTCVCVLFLHFSLQPAWPRFPEKILKGDCSVRGFWVPQRVAVFDTRILNKNAPSYKNLSLDAAFNIHRNEKKNKYSAQVEQRRGCFTPIIATCEGILDREAKAYIKRLAFHLSKRWGKSYSQT